VISFNPLFAYAAAGALAIGGLAGYKLRDWQCDAAVAKAYAKAEKQRQEIQDEMDRQASTYEVERDQVYRMGTNVSGQIRTIYKDRPAVPDDCVADPVVVGLLESSRASANASATGKPSK